MGPHRQSGRRPQKTRPAALGVVGWEDREYRGVKPSDVYCRGITPVDSLESNSRVVIWEGATAIT